jgi:hypothetical protein
MCVVMWSAVRTSFLSGGECGTGCVGLQVRRLNFMMGESGLFENKCGSVFRIWGWVVQCVYRLVGYLTEFHSK